MSHREVLRDELADLQAYVPFSPPGIKIRLDANEAPALPALREVVLRAVAEVDLSRYPDPRALALKDALARRTGAPASSLVVGSGSDELISLLATACGKVRGRQATVVVPTPTFVMYRITARTHGLRVVDVPLDASWDLDVSALKKAIDLLDPNLVFVASPNNPTGNRMSPERIEELASAAKRAVFVLDEAYVDYTHAGSLRELRSRLPNVAILRTLSKVGLAALRIGWLEADEEVAGALDKARQPFNVSATSQAAATAALDEAWPAVQAHVASIVGERHRVATEIARMPGLTVTPSEANFVWVKTTRPGSDVQTALIERGVLVRSFHKIGGRMAQQLRVTIGTPSDNDALLDALRASCA